MSLVVVFCGGCGGGGDGCGSVVVESVESTETPVTSSRHGCGSTCGVLWWW